MQNKIKKFIPHFISGLGLFVIAAICGHFISEPSIRFLPFFIAGLMEGKIEKIIKRKIK